jgi:exosortase
MAIGAFVIMCWGLFLFCFGGMNFRMNSFALLFLLFMVPLPAGLLDAIIGFLQRGSAEAADALFSAIGIPMFRDGFVFSLSHFTIHVAEECSGIRSFLSLLITSVVAGHWFLKSGWARVGLAVAVVPLAIIKNAFRIVGLALLANYVDKTYITNSALHRTGGIPLFLLSLVILFSLVWLLRKIETRTASKAAR